MEKRTIKESLLAILHDGAICILAGLATAVGIAAIAALISGLINGFDGYAMMNAVRSGLLIVGAILMFVMAGMMLGQKSNEKIRSAQKWKDTFHIFGPAIVFMVISVSVIAVATVVDYIVWLS